MARPAAASPHLMSAQTQDGRADGLIDRRSSWPPRPRPPRRPASLSGKRRPGPSQPWRPAGLGQGMGRGVTFLMGPGSDWEHLGAPFLLAAAQGRIRKRGECLEGKEDPLLLIPPSSSCSRLSNFSPSCCSVVFRLVFRGFCLCVSVCWRGCA